MWIPLVLLALSAQAAEKNGSSPYQTRPYISPRLNFMAYQVSTPQGTVGASQVMGGAEGGWIWRRDDTNPALSGKLRSVALVRYGLNTNGLGGELRTGLFGGPDFKLFYYHIGPDIWFNGYDGGSNDINLAWSPGVDLHNEARLFPHEPVSIVGMATPGWAFVPERAQGGLGPFHELNLLAAVVLDTKSFGLAVGISKTWDGFGERTGLVLSGGI